MIRNIIIGWWRLLTGYNSEEAKKRMEICKRCEFNKKGWCTVCGCKLSAKTKVESEECYEGKW